MNSEIVEVKFPKKDLIEFFLLYSIFVIVNILMFVFNFNIRLSVLLAVHLILIAFAMVYVTLMFKVCVENNTFHVRTRLGKKYSFDLSEISKIRCTKKLRPRLGPQFSLLIYVGEREIELYSEMSGFDKMASFLLDKINAREVNEGCISKNSKEELIKYSKRAYDPK